MQDSPKTSKTKTMVSLGIFAVAFVLMIVFQAIWSVALVFVSALIVGYAFITTGKSSPTNNEQILAFLEQKKIRQEWQQLLNEMDMVASQIAELRAAENKLSENIYQHTMELRHFFSDLGINTEPSSNWHYELSIYKKNSEKRQLAMELISKLEPLAEKQEAYRARLENLKLPIDYTDTEEKNYFSSSRFALLSKPPN